MNRRVFIGNFDFEHQLAQPGWQTPKHLERLNAELTAAWLAVADDGDYLWTPVPFPDGLAELAEHGLPKVIGIESLEQVPAGVECIPWGWSPPMRRLVDRFRWKANFPPDSAVRLANSRTMSAILEEEFGVALPGACRIDSIGRLQEAVAASLRETSRWVVKADFGMSGRERVIGNGPLTDVALQWCSRRLKSPGCLFFEPWVERLGEVGIQLEVPPTGPIRLVGLTPLEVDDRGQYSGSWISGGGEFDINLEKTWDEAVDLAVHAAARLQSVGYFGPLGIDAMRYRTSNGDVAVRPLQDINARWTMGRMALGWQRLIRPDDQALWQHGTFGVRPPAGLQQVQTIPTSPRVMGNGPCQHLSNIVIFRRGSV